MNSRVALVTGGSGGLGAALCDELALRGYRVFELSRRGCDRDGVAHITADVTDESAVRAALEQVVADAGRLDLLCCNAGFGISGAVEYTPNADAKRLMEVNLFGAVNATRAAITALRESKGRIVFTSSVAGELPVPFQAWYSISKASLNALTMALRSELRPFGISVAAVLPGDIATGFTAAREKRHQGDEVYGGRIERSVAAMEKDEQGGMTPREAAVGIARVCTKGRVKPFTVIGTKYKLFMALAHVLPRSAVSYIMGKMYS